MPTRSGEPGVSALTGDTTGLDGLAFISGSSSEEESEEEEEVASSPAEGALVPAKSVAGFTLARLYSLRLPAHPLHSRNDAVTCRHGTCLPRDNTRTLAAYV